MSAQSQIIFLLANYYDRSNIFSL